ncbi:MAG: adenylosuccinate lyase [Candidatus Diapherotrites archaeon CG08_land_8_20_14_0_20_30_16]|nr:MAG: adenylosuccinate lyase [Candidatus Diapherotrites archaeon CG08_land_8_20_14_0_20_30_16]
MINMDKLECISPIDGRYKRISDILGQYFSEMTLSKYRTIAEIKYFIFLSKQNLGLRALTNDELKELRALEELSLQDAQIIKDIEVKGYKNIKATNHDVKAVEYYLKDKLENSSLKKELEWIHFALTSEDINNIAYGLMVSLSVKKVIIPEIETIYNTLNGLAEKYANTAILARTHGQPASPTTFGKEFKVFAERIKKQLAQLKAHKLLIKLNGATGNYNANISAYPNFDWLSFSQKFTEHLNKTFDLNLQTNLITTQIEPHDSLIELFDILRRINLILINFSQDIWRYISDDFIKQKPVEGEVGSSTMPHKVNPIDFENAEGNLGLANSLFSFFSNKLPISRLQRDLSDSTVLRNIGSSFAYCLIAYKSIQKGLTKIEINETKVSEILDSHWEIISEAIQTILKREHIETPYELLKELTRGKKINQNEFIEFIDKLDVTNEVKEELKKLSPNTYIGLADKISKL